ncbi:MAG: CoA transferase, partial [Dehalococcoidia bacterium]
VPARRRVEDRLLAELACWSRDLEADELTCRLREAGIAAGVVSHAGDLATHPEFEARDFMRPIRINGHHTMRHAGVPWTTSHPDSLTFDPPPALGEQGHDVMRDILGYSEEQIDHLLAQL